MIKNLLAIRTKECASCGVVIAAHLTLCPYCGSQLPRKDLLTDEVSKVIEQKIRILDNRVSHGIHGKILTLLPVGLILFLPLICTAGIILIFNRPSLALIFFTGSICMSFSAIHAFYEYYLFSNFLLKIYWKKYLKTAVISYLKSKDLPDNSYYEVVINCLVKEPVPWGSDMNVALDE